MVLSEIGRQAVSTRRRTLGWLNVHYALSCSDMVSGCATDATNSPSHRPDRDRSPIGEPVLISSSCRGLRCPAEGGAILPEPVQQCGELAREGDFRLLGAALLAEPHGPRLERRPALDPGQQNVRGFEQVAAGEPVAALRDPTADVALAGLEAPRRKAEIGADTRRPSK